MFFISHAQVIQGDFSSSENLLFRNDIPLFFPRSQTKNGPCNFQKIFHNRVQSEENLHWTKQFKRCWTYTTTCDETRLNIPTFDDVRSSAPRGG